MHSTSLSGDDAISSAIAWFEGALVGPVATSIAIVAIATIGLLMLTGRVEVRGAAQVVFGCFIIFGASAIANGLLGAISGRGSSPDLAQSAPPPPPLPSAPATAQVPSTPYDPYARDAYLPPR